MTSNTLITIDPNVRVRNNLTVAYSHEIRGPIPEVGAQVTVIEPESGLHGPAQVVEVDHDADMFYLAVDWGAMWNSFPRQRIPVPASADMRIVVTGFGSAGDADLLTFMDPSSTRKGDVFSVDGEDRYLETV